MGVISAYTLATTFNTTDDSGCIQQNLAQKYSLHSNIRTQISHSNKAKKLWSTTESILPNRPLSLHKKRVVKVNCALVAGEVLAPSTEGIISQLAGEILVSHCSSSAEAVTAVSFPQLTSRWGGLSTSPSWASTGFPDSINAHSCDPLNYVENQSRLICLAAHLSHINQPNENWCPDKYVEYPCWLYQLSS